MTCDEHTSTRHLQITSHKRPGQKKTVNHPGGA
jgi:hypothetical protein